MMIESIELVNYQSHSKSRVEFDHGLNVIVGSSDSGKSSIIRALLTAITNSPSGEDLITHGQEELSVVVGVDGKTVERRRGKKNEYFLDGEVFAAFGRDVPQPIKDLFNLTEVNVQKQHDTVYLLSESPGEVARKLNQIVRLEKIDEVTKKLGSKQRDTKLQIRNAESEIESFQKQIEDLSWIDEAAVLVEEHDQLESRVSRRMRTRDQVARVVRDHDAIDLSELDWIEPAFVEVTEALSKAADLERQLSLLDEAQRIVGQIGRIDRELGEEFDFDGTMKLIDEAAEVKRTITATDRTASVVRGFVRMILDCVGLVEDLDKELVELEDEFHREMPDTCPLCGRSG